MVFLCKSTNQHDSSSTLVEQEAHTGSRCKQRSDVSDSSDGQSLTVPSPILRSRQSRATRSAVTESSHGQSLTVLPPRRRGRRLVSGRPYRQIDTNLSFAITFGYPMWHTNGAGGNEPKRTLLNFKTDCLKECARIDFYRGVCADDFLNVDWVRILDQLPKFRQILRNQQNPACPESLGNAVEMVVGIGYTAFMHDDNLPETHRFRWPSEQSRLAWDDVFIAFRDIGIKVHGKVPVRHRQSMTSMRSGSGDSLKPASPVGTTQKRRLPSKDGTPWASSVTATERSASAQGQCVQPP